MKRHRLIVDDDRYQTELIERVVGNAVPEYLHEYFIQRVFFHLMKKNEEDPKARWTTATIRKLIAKAVLDCEKKGKH
jgi:hypothetical protein